MTGLKTQRGYTLVELAMVLTVMSVTLAVVAPDFIATAGHSLAERSAEEMQEVVRAARAYYHDHQSSVPEQGRSWPIPSNPTASVIDCLRGGVPGCPEALLTSEQLVNPWGHPYDARVFDDTLSVQSWVPESLAGVVAASLPRGTCDPNARTCGSGDAPEGFRACCALSTPPTSRPRYEDIGVSEELCDDINGVFDATTHRCELFDFEPGDCITGWTDQCPDGFALQGSDVDVDCNEISTSEGWRCEGHTVVTRVTCCRNR